MHRIDTPTAVKDKFGEGKNGFTRGNPQTGTSATQVDYLYFDAIQEEIAKVIESTGVELNKEKHDQLYTAIKKIISDNQITINEASLTQKGIVQLGSEIDSDDETMAATLKAVNKIRELISTIKPYIGEFRLFPFRTTELPFGWYFRGGDNYLLSSPQGQALNSLSVNYKADHNITIKTIDGQQYINVPNAFASDGRGYFERASMQTGLLQPDAIRNITGSFNMDGVNATNNAGVLWGFGGAFYQNGTSSSAVKYAGNAIGIVAKGAFDASRVVPIAEENRPINMGLTPAIYLGV